MKKFRVDYVFDGIALALAGVQVEEVMKWVQLALGIVATIISLAFSLWQWWKKAHADGKITEEEIKDGIDILKNGTNEIKDHLDDKKQKGE